jgi:hypothetical protein
MKVFSGHNMNIALALGRCYHKVKEERKETENHQYHQ